MFTSSAAVAGALGDALRLAHQLAEVVGAEPGRFLVLPGRFAIRAELFLRGRGLRHPVYHCRNLPRVSPPCFWASSAAFLAMSVYSPC